MARVKRGFAGRRKHKKILNLAKGFTGSLSTLFRPAKQAVYHALVNAYSGRRLKKRDFRSLWIARISAALETHEVSFSKFMGQCKKNNIAINRKMLAELALNNPETFANIVEKAKA